MNEIIGDGNYILTRSLVVIAVFIASAFFEFLFVTNTNEFIFSLVSQEKSVASELPYFLSLLIIVTFLRGLSLFSLNGFVQFLRVRVGRELIVRSMHSSKLFSSGHAVGVLSNELDHLIGYYFLPVFNILFSFLTLFAIVFGALSEYPMEGSLVLGFGAFAYVVIYIVTRKTIKYNGEIRASASLDRTDFLASILPLSLLFKLNLKVESAAYKYDGLNYKISRAFFLNSLLSVMPKHLLEFLGFCAIAAALYFHNTSITSDASYYVPMIGSLMVVSVRILPPMQIIFQNYNQLLFSGPIIEKIEKLINNVSLKTPSKGAIRVTSGLTLKNLNDCLPKGSSIKNDSITLYSGDFIQLCGPSGSGKTSLLQAIASQNQKISYYDVDENTVDPSRLRIGYCLQNFSYFPGSIYENITLDLFGKASNDDFFSSILKICQLEDILKANGLTVHEQLNDNGKYLSGGEKQRVALARGLFNRPDILLIDEGTSGIENGLEAKIFNDIFKHFPNLILIITTHRNLKHSKLKKVNILRDIYG